MVGYNAGGEVRENLRGIQLSFLNKFLHQDLPEKQAKAKVYEFTEDMTLKSHKGISFHVSKGDTCVMNGSISGNAKMFCRVQQHAFFMNNNEMTFGEDLVVRAVQDWTMQDVWEALWQGQESRDGSYLDMLCPAGADSRGPLRFLASRDQKCAFLICPRDAKYDRVVCALYRHLQSKEIRVHEEDYYVWVDIFCSKLRRRDEAIDLNDDINDDAASLGSIQHELFSEQNARLNAIRQAIPGFLERLVYFDNFLQPTVLNRASCVWDFYCAAIGEGDVTVIHPAPIKFQDTNAKDLDGFYTFMLDLNPLTFIGLSREHIMIMFKKFATLDEGFRKVVAAIQNTFTIWLTKEMKATVYNFPATPNSQLTYIEALLACAYLSLRRAYTRTITASQRNRLLSAAFDFLGSAENEIENAIRLKPNGQPSQELIWKKGLVHVAQMKRSRILGIDRTYLEMLMQTTIFPQLADLKEKKELMIEFFLALDKYDDALETVRSPNFNAENQFGIDSSLFITVNPVEQVLYIHAIETFLVKVASNDRDCDGLKAELNEAVELVNAKENEVLAEQRLLSEDEKNSPAILLRKKELRFQKRKYLVHLGRIMYYLGDENLFDYMDESFFDGKLDEVESGSKSLDYLVNKQWVSNERTLPTRRITRGYGKRMFQIAVLTYAAANKESKETVEPLLLEEMCEIGRCFYGWQEEGKDQVRQQLRMLLTGHQPMVEHIMSEIFLDEARAAWTM